MDPRTLKKYDAWKESGRPLDWGKLSNGYVTFYVMIALFHDKCLYNIEFVYFSELEDIAEDQIVPESTEPAPTISTVDEPGQNIPSASGSLETIIGPHPFEAPQGFKWIPKWELVPYYYNNNNNKAPVTSTASLPGMSTPNNTSFEELFIQKVKTPASRNPRKRQKLDLRSQVNFAFLK